MKNKTIFVDSDVLIWFLRGKDDIVAELTNLIASQNILISPVSVTEIYAGARKNELSTISELFSLFNIVEINKDIAVKAGEYLRKYAKSHSVEIADAFIGASVSILDATLWTFNLKHYPMLKKSKFYNFTQ